MKMPFKQEMTDSELAGLCAQFMELDPMVALQAQQRAQEDRIARENQSGRLRGESAHSASLIEEFIIQCPGISVDTANNFLVECGGSLQ